MIFATGNAWSQATKGKKECCMIRYFDYLQHVMTSQIIATMLWDRDVSRISVIYVQGNLTITFPPERNKKLSLGSHDVAKPFGVFWPLADAQIKKSQKSLSCCEENLDAFPPSRSHMIPTGFLGFVRLLQTTCFHQNVGLLVARHFQWERWVWWGKWNFILWLFCHCNGMSDVLKY